MLENVHELISNEKTLNPNQTVSKILSTYISKIGIKIPCHKHCNNKFVRCEKTNRLPNGNRCKSSSSYKIINKNTKIPNCPIKQRNKDSIHDIELSLWLFLTLSHTNNEAQYTIKDMYRNTRMKRILSIYLCYCIE